MTSYEELNAQLLLAQAPKNWFPHAHQQGLSLRVGDLYGSKGSSLWICLRTGRWTDHSTGQKGGDLISLYAAIHSMSQSKAKRELEGGSYVSVTSTSPKAAKIPNVTDPEKLTYISSLWAGSISAQGTQVEKYLQSRGIDEFDFDDIRYLPKLIHTPSGNLFPAMVAAVRHGITGDLMAIHRTWLKPDGSGKADVNPNKMMLGQVLGGAVQLSDAKPEMIVAEGIETALSVLQATGITTWAALSTSGLKGLDLPRTVERIIIACDNDLEGLKAANASAEKWTKEGREVLLSIPPINKDFNDLLQGKYK